MGHDQRQRILMRRLDVDEVDVDAIDLADELRKRIQARRDPPEVVFVLPVTREGLQRPELDTLRSVGGQLLARPTCRADASAKIVELLFGNVDLEGATSADACVAALMVSPWLGGCDAGGTPAKQSAASPRRSPPWTTLEYPGSWRGGA